MSHWIKTTLLLLLLVLLFSGAGLGQGASNRTQADKSVAGKQTPASPDVLNTLTAAERAWLKGHPVIRVVQDPGWPPVEFANEKGEFVGMAGDYLNIIEQRLGIRFERVKGLNWQEAYARLKRREIDMTTSVAVTPERSQFWVFTKPYMKIPIVIVTHTDVTYIAAMQELAGKKVAIVDGYAVNDWIPQDFPDIQLVRFQTAQDCLKALSRGDVFAYIDNMLVVGYYMAKLKMTMLKIAGETPYINAQCMAVRKDWAPLASILQKALDSISEAQRNDIYRKWLPIRYEHGFDYTLLWYALAIFAVILLGMAAWNWNLAREIKSRKEAEKALRQSEEKFSIVFESANVGKSITLPSGEINVNKAYGAMLGYTQDEMKNKRWQDITPQEDIEATQAHLDSLLQGNSDSVRFNKRYLHKNGSEIWADVSIALHRITEHHPLFFITTLIDITDRMQAQKALMDRDALFAKITSRVPGMLYQFVRKPDGTYAVPYSNDGITNIFGCSPEDVRQTFDPIFTAIFPEDRNRVIQTIEASAKNLLPWMCEYRVQLPGEPVKWMFGNSIPEKMQDGAIVWSGYNTDITDHKHKEQELLEKEVQYRNLANAGLALIWTSGPDKLCNYFNEPWLKFTGRTLEQELGNGWTEGVHPDELERCVNIYVSAFDQRQSFDMEYRLKHASGEYRWIRDMGTPNYSAGGEFVGYIGHCFDITESKRAQEEIRKLNDDLEQKVQKRTTELTQIIAQLEETNKIFVGRELKMVELKKRIAELEGKA